MARLSNTLAEFGIDLDPMSFVVLLLERSQVMFPGWTIDELLVHPRDAIRFCESVRETLRAGDLPDDLVLRALLNSRKRD